ncbi:acyl-CoA N-acyltransferase [Hymenopellis radicata]|nr:acyl-CoA N-acyltransferase [Hymenopellis radicata]
MSAAFTTRPAQPGDIPAILHFIKELAIYEKEEDKAQATHAQMQEALFSESGVGLGGHVAWAIVAELTASPSSADQSTPQSATGKTPIGFALEDLYVTPAQRNLGVGRALFVALAKVALDHDCGRVDWSVLKWNTPSIGFYESTLKATRMEEWVGMRVEGREGLEGLLLKNAREALDGEIVEM